MHRVRLLRHHGIAPFLVFDGGPLPSKLHTEVKRASYAPNGGAPAAFDAKLTRSHRKRAEALQAGNALIAAGKASAAHDEFVKAIECARPSSAFWSAHWLNESL